MSDIWIGDKVFISNHEDGIKSGVVKSVATYKGVSDYGIECDDGDRWIGIPESTFTTREEAVAARDLSVTTAAEEDWLDEYYD